MMRVEDATGNLQQLSTKYESAYRAVTQQSESVALSNKQLVAGDISFLFPTTLFVIYQGLVLIRLLLLLQCCRAK